MGLAVTADVRQEAERLRARVQARLANPVKHEREGDTHYIRHADQDDLELLRALLAQLAAQEQENARLTARVEMKTTPDMGRLDVMWQQLVSERDAALAQVAQLREALEKMLADSGDPNAATGEYDTTAGRARRLLTVLAGLPEGQP